MRTKSEEKIVVKNVFKSVDVKKRKNDFNKKYEMYINFCENKIC